MSVGAVNKTTGDRIPTAGMPAIDAALSGSSTNPVQNRVVKAALDDKADTSVVETALALKQNVTDNTLETTAKTIVGGINELNSNLTDLGLSVVGGTLCVTYEQQ